MAMAGSLDDRYSANSMDILTMNAKALYNSRVRESSGRKPSIYAFPKLINTAKGKTVF